jgi:hypothetical protein
VIAPAQYKHILKVTEDTCVSVLKEKKLSQILLHTHLEFDKSFNVPIMYNASLILCLLIYLLNYTGFPVINGNMIMSEGNNC